MISSATPATWRTSRSAGRPSLRRRLLTFLVIPLAVILLINTVLGYSLALAYANHVHDRDLSDSAEELGKLLNDTADGTDSISSQARFLLEYDPGGRNYFSVRSARHGLQFGSDELPTAQPPPHVGEPTQVYGVTLGRRELRAASLAIDNVREAGDILTLVLAESMHDRKSQARELLYLTVPAEGLLVICVLTLVWFGVSRGLRELEPLTARLASREHDLAPIGDADVPEEILPLTRTIDGLFARLRGMLALQERFIADAAHQLRTPLTGLRVHAERIQTDRSEPNLGDALQHIQRLVSRATRTSGQLLALTRVQSIQHQSQALRPLELSLLIPTFVVPRVHEALAAGIDLGFEGVGHALWVLGDAPTLQELIDNLIDNCLRYAGRGRMVTVALEATDHDGVILSVEDNGPGVPPAYLSRLGERFFRVPGSDENGTGLGLAIARRIAERHHGQLRHLAGHQGGLRVELRLPLIHPEHGASGEASPRGITSPGREPG